VRILKRLRQRGANIPDARDTKTVAIDFRLRPDGAHADTLSPHLEIDRGSHFSSRLWNAVQLLSQVIDGRLDK
jgi:hypothetical protein